MIHCCQCYKPHKPRADKFPEIRLENKVIDGKFKQVIIGYVCKKCVNKSHRKQFIQKHDIKPVQGRTLAQIIQDKIKSLTKGESNG